MADPNALVGQVKQRWQALPPRMRWIVIGATAMATGAAVLLVSQQAPSPDSVLFSNLSSQDAGQIVERLQTMNVPYELAEGGTAIMVPDTQVHDTRLTLASEGLPAGGGVGFEIFDEQRFGESEFAEQVKYHRALEGELSRTIGHLAGVEKARVHLVLPERSLFTSSEQKATASVALRLQPGWQMGEDRVRGIIHLVASSVRGLLPERVTVVDGQGRRLSSSQGGEQDVASDALSYRREIEAAKERAVQEMLDTTLGSGNSIVRVAAKVSFTREERTEERFDPKGTAARSFQIEEEREGSGSTSAAGVPGTVSNLPGGEPPTAGENRQGVTRRSETRNFEVSKTVRRAVEPVGRVQRLQVAVMVDGKWTGEGEAKKFEPRKKEELDQIATIVASAAGLDKERGDEITVECVPFVASPNAVDDVTDPIAPYIDPYKPYFPYVGYLLAFIAGLIVLRKVKRWIRQLKDAPVPRTGEPGAPTSSVTVQELGAGVANKVAANKALPESSDTEAAAIRALAAEMADREPEAAARVIRGWLGEEAA